MLEKKNSLWSFIPSILVALLIIAMLITSKPASAVDVSIIGLSGLIAKGDSTSFDITISLQDVDKLVPITDVTLKIIGTDTKQWTFNPFDGTIIIPANDQNMSVQVISSLNSVDYGNGSGFGRDNLTGEGFDFNGFGYGDNINISFSYRITILTADLSEGSYDVIAYLNTGNSNKPFFASRPVQFIISSASTSPSLPAEGNDGIGGSSGVSYSGSYGGGGGGGGGTTGENYSNIELLEKYEKYIFVNKVTKYTFNNIKNPIIFVNITGNVNAGAINTIVEVLRNTSALVKSPAPGNVYKNINIWVGTSGFPVPKNIKTAVIDFRISNSWLENNSLGVDDVVMIKWDGTKWIQLETEKILEDDAYTYYKAETNSFSCFAITGMKNKLIPSLLSSLPGTAASDIQSGNKLQTSTNKSESVKPAATHVSLIIGIFILIGIVVTLFLKKYR
jgi:PGF-pre-PGF domain-containing protein